MYERKHYGYLVGFLIMIVLLFLLIILIVNHKGSSKNKVDSTQQTLTSYADKSGVTLSEVIVGPINADQSHTNVHIDINNTSTYASVAQGYTGNVTNSYSYPMTTDGFREFLAALDKAGFTKGDTAANLKDDKGYCSTGQRYIFTINDNGKTLQRFWATSCSGTRSYKGNLGLTNTLFQRQVPDYNKLVQGTSFQPTLFGL